MRRDITPTGVERFFDEDEIIVSKTNPNGQITYVNDVFVRVAGWSEAELIGAPHSIIRHPEMPRAVFHLLWQTITAGREIFAYIVNLSRTGEHYWVLAHVTPSLGPDGRILGFHSNRRTPRREALQRIQPIYRQLLTEEARHSAKADQVAASTRLLEDLLRQTGQSYDEYVWSLENQFAGAGA